MKKLSEMRFASALMFALAIVVRWPTAHANDNDAVIRLGQHLFRDVSMSRDRTVSCQTCHDPAHAYADSHPRSVGVGGAISTRNAPSLLGIGDDTAFFWDGRRGRLDEAVLDPLTNPVELALPSTDIALQRLKRQPGLIAAFRTAYPDADSVPTIGQIQFALTSFIRSLPKGTSDFDTARSHHRALSARAEEGRRLFEGVAGCSECHRVGENGDRFSDGRYHHSGIEQTAISSRLPDVTSAVRSQNLDFSAIGPKVLMDSDWSALGRFVVTHDPADIGAFHTPSLRNVAVTGPYMHDGSIATLADAVDHEIYYRGLSKEHPINLAYSERRALVAFLESLTDAQFATSSESGKH